MSLSPARHRLILVLAEVLAFWPVACAQSQHSPPRLDHDRRHNFWRQNFAGEASWRRLPPGRDGQCFRARRARAGL